ncbi:nucleotidyltransferase domain-containing protein [Thermococcus sp.]|uniref:nucleotidyltransferase domain-containing protein n=1 Tax=Thermococcus sp. TaxID=35749 RepID=UPI002609D286|nr:nucleotidyltransferase domain-containing protein [Thermococcus sp.]
MRAERLMDCIQKKLDRISGLHSLILYGSLIRGDFIPGTSDVDFFVVLKDGTEPEPVLQGIRPVLKECSSFLNPVEIDVAWEWLSNLRNPLSRGYPYKFLTIYQRDFRENHAVVIGEDVVTTIPTYPMEELLSARLESTLRNLERFSGNRKMLHILAGETARLLAFLNGSSLRKGDVIKKLEELGDMEALEVYKSYLDERKTQFREEFLKEFIRSRVEKLKGTPLLP